MQQGNQGGGNQGEYKANGERKAPKPVAVQRPVDIKEIGQGCGEVARNENDGVGVTEPNGQGKDNICHEKRACNVAEPV